MINYIVTRRSNEHQSNRFPCLINKIKFGNSNEESWTEFFFTKDIYIIGLTLDFVKIHLWWLLNYMIRTKIIKKLPIKNKIIYFYPSEYVGAIKNKLKLMESYEILPYSIPKGREWKEYYSRIINKIKNDR